MRTATGSRQGVIARSTLYQTPGAFLVGLLGIPLAIAGGMISTNFAIPTDSLNTGGSRTTSSSYILQGSIGVAVIGGTNSASYTSAGYPQAASSGATDADGDGLDDTTEALLGTNPNLADTDGDGLSDYDEVNADGDPLNYTPGVDTDPTKFDTDDDGIPDDIDPVIDLFNGDIAPLGNRDGDVNTADLLIAQRVALGLYTPTDDELLYGDVNQDGDIDLADVLLIQKIILAP